MTKLITTTVLAVAGFALLASDADAAWPRRWRTYTAAPAPIATAPATTAQATEQGYRTFSYQPTTPSFQTYRPRKLNAWEYQKTDSRRYNGGN
jgi:hypothetical protein